MTYEVRENYTHPSPISYPRRSIVPLLLIGVGMIGVVGIFVWWALQ